MAAENATVVGKIAIKVLPDTTEFRRELRAKLQKELAGIAPEVKVKLDLDEASLHHVKERLDDLEDDERTVEVNADLDTIYARARLLALTRPRTVKIFANVDEKSFKNVLTRMAGFATGGSAVRKVLKDIWDNLKNIDKNVPKITFITLAIGALTIAASALLSNLFALSKSLAQIGKLGLLVPGFLGSIAIGVTALIAALMDFNKELPQVKKAVTDIRQLISANFWTEARAPMAAFFDDLIPIFRDGMSRIGTEMGKGMGTFAEALRTTLNPAVEQMFTDLSNAIGIAEGAAAGIAQQITVFGQVGASYLPAFAQWFTDINTRFGQFLTDAQQSGDLYVWMDQGIDSLKALGSVLASTGSILTSFATAADAAGGSSMQMLATRMQELADAAKQPEFQNGLTTFLASMHDAMGQIRELGGPGIQSFLSALSAHSTEVFGNIGTAFGTLVGSLAEGLASDDFMGGLVDATAGMRDMMSGLAPAMTPLTAALGSILTLVGTFAGQLGPLLASVLGPISGLVSSLVPQITPLITMLTGGLKGALDALLPALIPIADMLVGTLGTAFQALLPPVFALVEGVAPLITMLGTALTPILNMLASIFVKVGAALMPLVQKLLTLLSAVLEPLLGMLGPLIAELLEPIGDAIVEVVDALSPLMDVLTEIVGAILPVLMPLVKFLVEMLGDMLKGIVKGIASIVKGVTNVLGGLVNVIKGIFSGDWSAVGDGLKQMLLGLWETIKGVALVLINILPIGRLKVLAKAAGKIFASIAGVIMKVLRPIGGFISGLWGRITGLFSKGAENIGKLWSRFTGWLSGGVEGLIAGVRNNLNGYWQAIVGWFDNIVGWFRGIWDNIMGAFRNKDATNPFQFLTDGVDYAKGVLKGFVDGIVGTFNNIRTSISNALAFVKGLVSEFVEGLVQRFTNVRVKVSEIPGIIRQVFTDLVAWFKGLPKAIGDTLSGLWTVLRDNFGSSVKKILDPIKKLGSDIFKSLDDALGGRLSKVIKPVLNVFNNLRTGIGKVVNFVKKFVAVFKKDPEKAMDILKKAVQKKLHEVVERFKKLPQDVKDKLAEWGAVMLNIGQNVVQGLVDGIKNAPEKVKEIAQKIYDNFVKPILEFFGIASPSKVMKEIGTWIIEGLINGIKGLLDGAGGLFALIGNIASKMIAKFKEGIDKLTSTIKSGLGKSKTEMKGGLSKVTGEVKSWGKSVNSEMNKASKPLGNAPLSAAKSAVNGVAGQLNKVVSQIKGLASRVKSAASGLNTSTLYNIGRNVIQGLINGMESKRPQLDSKVRSLSNAVTGAATTSFQVRSPSRVFMEIGAYLVEGLTLGITRNAAEAVGATAAMARNISDSFDAELNAPAFSPTVSRALSAEVDASIEHILDPMVYVQNPWGPDYMQAKVDERVDEGFYVRENMR